MSTHGPSSSGSAGVLAVAQYAPAAQTSLPVGSSFGPISSANLTVEFTTTSSGKGSSQVLVELTGLYETEGDTGCYIGLTNHTGGATMGYWWQPLDFTSATPYLSLMIPVLVTGLSPSTAYQVDWAGVGTTSTKTALLCIGQTSASAEGSPAIMKVLAV